MFAKWQSGFSPRNMVATTIQIVPRLPPWIDGVGDYALNLARELRKSHNIETHFIVGDPEWDEPSKVDGFRVNKIDSRSPNALFELLHNQNDMSMPILLHYVGYGYAKRGCPFWLLEALKNWGKENSQVRLMTMFHELYASGPPWRSSFWVSPIQRGLAWEISKLSDFIFTSRNQYGNVLRRWNWASQKAIHVIPVFSNVGEPKEIPPLKNRQRRMIVFGKNRRQIYTDQIENIFQACRALNIEEIVDVGPLTGLDIKDIRGIPLVSRGELRAEEISSLMLGSTTGFLDCPTNFLGKSTIFAAYCVHGLVPVAGKYIGDADGLKMGKHYLVMSDDLKVVLEEEMQMIACNANAWYQEHSLARHAGIIAAYLVTP